MSGDEDIHLMLSRSETRLRNTKKGVLLVMVFGFVLGGWAFWEIGLSILGVFALVVIPSVLVLAYWMFCLSVEKQHRTLQRASDAKLVTIRAAQTEARLAKARADGTLERRSVS